MPLIPWKYLTNHLPLSNYLPAKLGEKLTYHGLETKVVEKWNNVYLEFDTLPNRPDLLSWWGLIKEIGIILNCQIRTPTLQFRENEKKVIEVENQTEACSDFNLGFIKNIEIKESSDETKEWLKVNNINPINNIVDIANLVMLETGQPLHIFDYDTLSEKKIVIRKARHGEKIKALNNQELNLDSEDIVISSGEKIIDLAGIIGTQETAINSYTKNILIECASFDSKFIKKTTKRLNISTTAGKFFSREANLIISPKQVLNYIVSLIKENCQNNSISVNLFSYWEQKKTPLTIPVSNEFITKKTGQSLNKEVIEKIWQQLGFSYQKKEDFYYVNVPLSRPDIVNSEDLLEELLRIYDYNDLTSYLPNDFSSISSNKDKKKNSERTKNLRSYLTSQGWQEIITYSLISEGMKEDFEKENKTFFHQLLMPKNEHHKYYRQNLISSHLKTLSYNFSHQNKDLFFFEISSVYGNSYKEEFLILSGSGNLLNQPLHKLINKIDFFWLKGILENIFILLRINSKISFSSNHLKFPQSNGIFLEQEKIGFLGQVESPINKKYQISEKVFVAQISLTKIFDYLNNNLSKFRYRPISNFPVSEKDLSFIFPNEIDYNEVIEEIKKTAEKNIQEIKVFDIYQNDKLAKEKRRSISFRLIFQSTVKTLESKEIEKMLKDIVKKVEKKFAAELRN
ncbi:MAG: Phenylalanine--tRNA ligase beta subunit [Mycoplasmataceae bacterium]|nr:MAG: Phenylalanine--tRNA ligase beta subunit [Mycoplasmataceae bacterium]